MYPVYICVFLHESADDNATQIRRSRYVRHGWLSKNEIISDVLWWTSTHGHTSTDQPAKTFIHKVCADIGCSLEDLPGAMNDRDGWSERQKQRQRDRERESRDSVLSTRLDDDVFNCLK